AARRGPACGLGAPAEYLRDPTCEAGGNLGADFATTFGCLGDFGTSGCAPGAPLAAALAALSGPGAVGGDPPVLRQGAYLLVLVLASADDASGARGLLVPVEGFVTAFKALKTDSHEVVVAVRRPPEAP